MCRCWLERKVKQPCSHHFPHKRVEAKFRSVIFRPSPSIKQAQHRLESSYFVLILGHRFFSASICSRIHKNISSTSKGLSSFPYFLINWWKRNAYISVNCSYYWRMSVMNNYKRNLLKTHWRVDSLNYSLTASWRLVNLFYGLFSFHTWALILWLFSCSAQWMSSAPLRDGSCVSF